MSRRHAHAACLRDRDRESLLAPRQFHFLGGGRIGAERYLAQKFDDALRMSGNASLTTGPSVSRGALAPIQ